MDSAGSNYRENSVTNKKKNVLEMRRAKVLLGLFIFCNFRNIYRDTVRNKQACR